MDLLTKELNEHYEQSISRPVRSIRQFAEEEITLPKDGGPFGGQKFRIDRQPIFELLWEELDSGNWAEALVTGCVQSGKTFGAFVTPVLYITFELRKSPIAAIPIQEMISDKWNADLAPVLRANPNWEKLLPTRGSGSRGGDPKGDVELANGLSIKFLTRGGSDVSKAGYTAPFIVVTEAAAWSHKTGNSEESNPLNQVRGRAMSASKFDEEGNVSAESMLIVEGTVTVKQDLPLSEWHLTTQSRIACPCPHCDVHVTPEREHLKGWKEAKSELEAAKKAHFVCPNCDSKLSIDDRNKMNQEAVLLHDGQQIIQGEIVGEKPQVSKLGFRYNAFNNLFLKPADFATMEWNAIQIEDPIDREDEERRICQQIWVIGYEAPEEEEDPDVIKPSWYQERQDPKFNRYDLLPYTEQLIATADVGKFEIHWGACCYEQGFNSRLTNIGIEHTGVKTSTKDQGVERRVVDALLRWYERQLEDEERYGRPFEAFGVDCGYLTDSIFAFKEQTGDSRVYCVMGTGDKFTPRGFRTLAKTGSGIKSGHHMQLRPRPDKKKRRQKIMHMESNYHKRFLQYRVQEEDDSSGRFRLFAADELDELGDHEMLSEHMANVVYDHELAKFEEGSKNHFNDMLYYNMAMSWWVGNSLEVLSRSNDQSKPKMTMAEKIREKRRQRGR